MDANSVYCSCRLIQVESDFPFNRLLPFDLFLTVVASLLRWSGDSYRVFLAKSDSLQVQFLLGAAGIGLVPVRLSSLDQRSV